MITHRSLSRRRGCEHPKGLQRVSTTSFDDDAIRSCNQPHPTNETSRAVCLPSDLWTRLFPFLTWQDTQAMLCVCVEWKKIVKEAKTLSPEWRSTVFGPRVDRFKSLELLRTNHLNWADTHFVPDLIVLAAASKDTSPWHRGKYWSEAIAAIEAVRLLPPRCRVVGIFTMNTVLGPNEEEIHEVETTAAFSAVTLSISVAHLPDTTVEMAEFDRKDLRRCHHRRMKLENPFTAVGADTPSFLLFGVNDQSARQLIPVIEEWYPGAALVGAVSPLSNQCVPLATYCGQVVAGGGRQDRKKNRGSKQPCRHQPRLRGHIAFPSTMSLCLHGKVGIKSFSSCGYYPITPVIRCVHSEELSQVVAHDLVSVLESEGVTQHRIVDLLDPSERLAIEREGRSLNIFSCQDGAPLQHLFDCCSTSENKALVPSSAPIDRLEFVFWLQNSLVSLPGLRWQEGTYGILASHQPTRPSPALAKALRNTQASLASANGRAFGAFVVAGALNDVDDSSHASEIGQLCADILRECQLGGCVVSASIGPVAFPGGVQSFVVRNISQTQTHTTSGAVFYTK